MRARVTTLGTFACLSALLSLACGGDKSGDRTDGTGGSTASGGSSSTSGGSTNSGTGGSAGMAALQPYPCDAKATALSDFTASIDSTGKWGTSATLSGGSFSYGDADGDKSVDITLTYATGEVAIKGHIATYTGFGLWFGAASGQMYPCIDASAYQGVSFEVVNRGTTTPSINFQVQHHDTSPVDTANKRGGCVWTSESSKYSDCVYPNTAVTIPTDGSAIQIPWSMFAGGKPTMGADGGAKLDGLQWEFWKADATPYDLDISIKNIKFY
ncbi:MAG: hypothetical protein ACOY0T_11990 [Myxococcota bacterium]